MAGETRRRPDGIYSFSAAAFFVFFFAAVLVFFFALFFALGFCHSELGWRLEERQYGVSITAQSQ